MADYSARFWRLTRQIPRRSVVIGVSALCALLIAFGGFGLAHAWSGKPASATRPNQGKECAMSASLGRVPLPGHLVPALAQLHPTGPMACAQTVQLTINLNMQDKAGLDALLAAQNDPQSPEYHQYLTPQEFAARFGQPQANIDAITHYLQSQGMRVDTVASNHLSIHVTATVAQIAQAFGVQLMNFTYQGRAVYAPTVEPSVPGAIAPFIQGVTGLDDVGMAHPLGR